MIWYWSVIFSSNVCISLNFATITIHFFLNFNLVFILFNLYLRGWGLVISNFQLRIPCWENQDISTFQKSISKIIPKRSYHAQGSLMFTTIHTKKEKQLFSIMFKTSKYVNAWVFSLKYIEIKIKQLYICCWDFPISSLGTSLQLVRKVT